MTPTSELKRFEAISCGLGAPSTFMVVLAAEKTIPCDLIVVANTQSENDRTLSDGTKITNAEYLKRVVRPIAERAGIEIAFPIALDKYGVQLPKMQELLLSGKTAGVPLFGDRGGRLKQACTAKYKIAAVRQELRRRGVRRARVALGLTFDEIHRIKDSDVKWATNWWPLIEMRLRKYQCRKELERRGIPYLMSSECDHCPHKDFARWQRSSEKTISLAEDIESSLDGLYLTKYCCPIRDAIRKMQESKKQGELYESDSCDSGYCFT